ncbi:hypothetical protein D3C77_486990 [compost metagenome]
MGIHAQKGLQLIGAGNHQTDPKGTIRHRTQVRVIRLKEHVSRPSERISLIENACSQMHLFDPLGNPVDAAGRAERFNRLRKPQMTEK